MNTTTPPIPLLPRALRWVSRCLVYAGAGVLLMVLICTLAIAAFGWNWLRGPVEQYALQKTGRVLASQGDLTAQVGWGVVHIQVPQLSFANPSWAQHRQMLSAQGVEVNLDIGPLFYGKWVFSQVRLAQADVALERSREGRKSWLLDLGQVDEGARIGLGQVSIGRGSVGFDDPSQETSLSTALTTVAGGADGTASAGLQFTVRGLYKGLPVKGQGNGGPVLALRETQLPYPLKVRATAGATSIALDGTVTDLQTLNAADLHMELRGNSLEELYPLLGMAFPATRPYTAAGRLVHNGSIWRFEKMTGRVGGSDLAGFAQVLVGGKRPLLTAEITSNRLALDDLGPVIGARPGSVKQAVAQPQDTGHVLPDMPFNTERWQSVDADVHLRAKSLLRDRSVPLENLLVHLSLQDGLLTLNPLNFGLAGGQLEAAISLDGRQTPLAGRVQARIHKVRLGPLFPTLDLGKNNIGQVQGEFNLQGRGNSVGNMLASADGQLSLVVSDGQISQLMIEKAGLHLWEILGLSLTGDRLIKLRCAVADFDVKQGTMKASALVLDTQVSTLLGSGSIDLKNETLDLALEPRTKTTSPLSLRSPIYIRGSFAQPRAQVDKGRLLTRAAGAVGLGLLNPLLALLPLVDAGPGQDSDCGELVRDAKSRP